MITGNRTTFITYGNRARVMFTFDMQRKPLYYVVNLIVPCCLLSCIVAITFILPPTCYMRLTLSTYILHVRSSRMLLPSRRYASAVFATATCLSVWTSVRHTPVLCLAERKQDREMYTV